MLPHRYRDTDPEERKPSNQVKFTITLGQDHMMMLVPTQVVSKNYPQIFVTLMTLPHIEYDSIPLLWKCIRTNLNFVSICYTNGQYALDLKADNILIILNRFGVSCEVQ